jgi:hypothetical protein
MRLLFSFFVACLFFASCKNHTAPDVSNIKIDLSTERFDRDLFALDTNNIVAGLDQLMAKYPAFGQTFLAEIIRVNPAWTPDTIGLYVKGFVSSYRPIYDSAEKVFKDFSPYEKQIRSGLQYAKYYFPEHKFPSKVITYVGPMDGTGAGLGTDFLAIGLQLHLGAGFSAYQTALVQETYPAYVSARFDPSYIPVDAMNVIISDMYPATADDNVRSLVIQMVEKGKRLYLLQSFLPATPEHKLIGYTEKQLKESYAHEASIWALFVQNNLLQSVDNNLTKNYVEEGPKTPELGEGSPGNIGSFAGWQIVKKYMDKNPSTTLKALMALDPERLFQDTKYKP